MKRGSFVCLVTFVAVHFAGCAASESAEDVAPAETRSTATAPLVPRGEQLYATHCLSCHQADGGGVPNMQPSILDSPWVTGDPKALALFVMSGGFDSANRKDSAVDNVMPEFRQLSDDELAGVLSYVRQAFGDGAPPVTPAEVAEARASLPAS